MKYELNRSMCRKARHGAKTARRDSHKVIKAEARRGRGTAVRRAIEQGLRD